MKKSASTTRDRLVAQLRGIAAEAPYLAAPLVTIIAEAMKDEELKALADNYATNAVYDDEALATDDEAEATAVIEAEAGADDEETAASEEPVDVLAKAQRAARLAKILLLIDRKPAPQ